MTSGFQLTSFSSSFIVEPPGQSGCKPSSKAQRDEIILTYQ